MATSREVVGLWHHVKAKLLSREPDSLPPIVECPICRTGELAIGGCPPSDPTVEQTVGVMLVCGHMTCKSCYEDWERHQLARGIAPSCPVCRFAMMRRMAGPCVSLYLIDPFEFPPYHDSEDGSGESSLAQWVGKLPGTLPEGYDIVHPRCPLCGPQRTAGEPTSARDDTRQADFNLTSVVAAVFIGFLLHLLTFPYLSRHPRQA
ncbi:hypothetical protein QBC42DRAFT_283459 [Cladorrhinum samala]|uniref:RING-type domain-containing protein n=1 Tax=Cladorrhinum samala TaxID=585594 RepID=A0AAV9HX72_9PEZI|nr:hypothetical protein QBC42DRAFT_283459 [Cladorrhinum samala]